MRSETSQLKLTDQRKIYAQVPVIVLDFDMFDKQMSEFLETIAWSKS